MKFFSNRLYIKKLDINEINDDVMSWFDNEDLMKYYTNSKNIITKESLVNYIKENESSGSSYTYGIYYIETDQLIGTIKIGPINKIHKTSDLVVLIGNIDYHGKGLATEAIKLGNHIAFTHHNIRKLFGGMYETNIASIKAYTNAGWIIEGKLKDHYIENDRFIDRILVACFNTDSL